MNVIPSCSHSVSIAKARAVARLHQQSADHHLAERQRTIARALSWYARRVEFMKKEKGEQ